MIDPFQDVDSFGTEFLQIVTVALENRAAEDQMIPIIERYLDDLSCYDGGLHLEIGAGTGAITRRMAAKAQNGKAIGIDPSNGLIEKAKELSTEIKNLTFEVGNGASLRFEDNSIDNIVMHTVLSHVPDPLELLNEAIRVLKPNGRIAICDADFEKSSLGNFDGDPLKACSEYFVRNFVTQPYLISDIRVLASKAGFKIVNFRIDSRAITNTDAGLAWIKMATGQMLQKGQITASLAESLAEEYTRRKESGILYGFQPFGSLVAEKPA
jgi:ubiquinone/menaquinone biosynthesis C-methylase UbiE